MANVSGIRGVLDMIRAGENSPVDIFIPSCVPSTSPELKDHRRHHNLWGVEACRKIPGWPVGEVMSYRTIIRENRWKRFLKQLREKDRIFPIERPLPCTAGPGFGQVSVPGHQWRPYGDWLG